MQRPGEGGHLVGLDRIPQVRAWRAKLNLRCQQAGRGLAWNRIWVREIRALDPGELPQIHARA